MKQNLTHQEASTKKRVFSLLIDYFLLVVANVIFYFLLVSQVANNLPFVKDISSEFYSSYDSVETLIDESKLNSLTKENYIKMSVKSSLGEDYYPLASYDQVSFLTKENDSLYYYFYVFKEENIDDYLDGDFTKNDYLLNIEKSNYFDVQDDYYVLKEEEAVKLGDYLFNNNEVFLDEYNSFSNFINEQFN